ncbi:hypothetical protein TRFO_32348 [Tritrichomonas foetus]|uniref:Ubiquitin-like domain-containing protein n=1 Tax=Tritrichomonas foetus TaxID=1144522 RepID=A0A1J4JPA4_9EUKA|nr:hypothetical protein TRFO_32348 [Tritrichomonas foetus]|eukprot:OHT00875.1 hypothetical protein TRFO_32348 [Tritrichomonas foetus]
MALFTLKRNDIFKLYLALYFAFRPTEVQFLPFPSPKNFICMSRTFLLVKDENEGESHQYIIPNKICSIKGLYRKVAMLTLYNQHEFVLTLDDIIIPYTAKPFTSVGICYQDTLHIKKKIKKKLFFNIGNLLYEETFFNIDTIYDVKNHFCTYNYSLPQNIDIFLDYTVLDDSKRIENIDSSKTNRMIIQVKDGYQLIKAKFDNNQIEFFVMEKSATLNHLISAMSAFHKLPYSTIILHTNFNYDFNQLLTSIPEPVVVFRYQEVNLGFNQSFSTIFLENIEISYEGFINNQYTMKCYLERNTMIDKNRIEYKNSNYFCIKNNFQTKLLNIILKSFNKVIPLGVSWNCKVGELRKNLNLEKSFHSLFNGKFLAEDILYGIAFNGKILSDDEILPSQCDNIMIICPSPKNICYCMKFIINNGKFFSRIVPGEKTFSDFTRFFLEFQEGFINYLIKNEEIPQDDLIKNHVHDKITFSFKKIKISEPWRLPYLIPSNRRVIDLLRMTKKQLIAFYKNHVLHFNKKISDIQEFDFNQIIQLREHTIERITIKALLENELKNYIIPLDTIKAYKIETVYDLKKFILHHGCNHEDIELFSDHIMMKNNDYYIWYHTNDLKCCEFTYNIVPDITRNIKYEVTFSNHDSFQFKMNVDRKNSEKIHYLLMGLLNFHQIECNYQKHLLFSNFSLFSFPPNSVIDVVYTHFKGTNYQTFFYDNHKYHFALSDNPLKKILENKILIQKNIGLFEYSLKCICFKFANQQLDENQTFLFYMIPEFSIIYVQTSTIKSTPTRLNFNGQNKVYYFSQEDTIGDVRDHISREFNYPKDKIILKNEWFKELHDNDIIPNYLIAEVSQRKIKFVGSLLSKLKLLNMGHEEFEFDETMKVEDVINSTCLKFGIPTQNKSISLISNDKILPKDKIIRSIKFMNIYAQSMITVKIQLLYHSHYTEFEVPELFSFSSLFKLKKIDHMIGLNVSQVSFIYTKNGLETGIDMNDIVSNYQKIKISMRKKNNNKSIRQIQSFRPSISKISTLEEQQQQSEVRKKSSYRPVLIRTNSSTESPGKEIKPETKYNVSIQHQNERIESNELENTEKNNHNVERHEIKAIEKKELYENNDEMNDEKEDKNTELYENNDEKEDKNTELFTTSQQPKTLIKYTFQNENELIYLEFDDDATIQDAKDKIARLIGEETDPDAIVINFAGKSLRNGMKLSLLELQSDDIMVIYVKSNQELFLMTAKALRSFNFDEYEYDSYDSDYYSD